MIIIVYEIHTEKEKTKKNKIEYCEIEIDIKYHPYINSFCNFSHCCLYARSSLLPDIETSGQVYLFLKKASSCVAFLSSQNYILSLYSSKIIHKESTEMLILMTASFSTSAHYIKLVLKKWIEHTCIQNNEWWVFNVPKQNTNSSLCHPCIFYQLYCQDS